ncbi:hypothetical protein VT91_09290 [Clostridium sporogenes]|uniref:DUF6751 family protein n=1 Tax=Clostridium botulinum TaxID=1491 RepID=UPI0007175909|nr:DUF6751 family protein [Clostridium botulinum]KRU29315.1 hypothetical protein WG71_15580 [Clostridium sporogenes]KRU33403.1 hypothetical protein VT91_09290 [Clostridium sporogenes]KRU33965.1 hypothetical protein VT28_05210 [Clostridium sporogenes]KRU43387.1 hypothetical protein VT95_16520 [Clostridium sporogenes]MBZ1330962.1 hypothetical protein [Clostridium botulinum]
MGVLFKNADITIYNKWYDSMNDIDKYQRTVIKGVNWQSKRNGTVSDKGLLLADSTLIFIDKLDNYISPKNFLKLSNEERPNYFTFVPGDKIVKCITDFEVTCVKPYRIADLESEFDDVIDIKSVNPLSNHFEIEGV